MFSVQYDEDYTKSEVVGCMTRNLDDYSQRVFPIGLSLNLSIGNFSLLSILRHYNILNRYITMTPLKEAWKPRFRV